jgi:methanogen homoaconitase large subunit
MEGRLTLCNLSVEAGAKTGLFFADRITCGYLERYGHTVRAQQPEEAVYEQEYEIACGEVVPMVAVPPRVDTVRPVSELAGICVDQVLVGTCTNGRYEDLAQLARFVRGKKVAVRTIVVPASRQVLESAIRTGVLSDIIAAGCAVLTPGCGPCLGAHAGVIGEGEVCLSTANRNFKNRMGVGGDIYLSSVATAAASALTGVLTEPEMIP